MPGLLDFLNPSGGLGAQGGFAASPRQPNYALMALGQGIADHDVGGAFARYAPVVAQGQRQNATAQYLITKGIAKTPDEAMALAQQPELLRLAIKEPDAFQTRAEAWVRLGGKTSDPGFREFALTGDIAQPVEPKAPKIEEFFDEAGAPYKGIYDPATDTVKKIGGSRVSGATETQRNNLSKARQAAAALGGSLDNYEKLATGVTVLPGQAKDNLNQARTDIMLQLKELYNLGVLNGPDYQLMQGMIFDPTVTVDPSNPIGTIGDIGSKVLGGDVAKRTQNSIAKLKEVIQRSLAAAEATNPANRSGQPGMDGGGVIDAADYFKGTN